MVRVRPAAVAGRFYPADPAELAALVDAPAGDAAPTARPPAGRRWSRRTPVTSTRGAVAAAAYAQLAAWREVSARVVVLGPAHFVPLHGMAVPSVDAFATPLGPVPVDAEARTRSRPGCRASSIDDDPHAGEHAIETQLPFLLRTLGPGCGAARARRADRRPRPSPRLLVGVLTAPTARWPSSRPT